MSADEFNASFPVGTPVTYYPIIGERRTWVDTKTRSEAWALGSGRVVVLIEGRAGGVAIEAIEKRSVAA